MGYRQRAYDSGRRSALELGWRHLGEERHAHNQPNLKVTLLSAKVPIATIINLGQKVFLSVEEVDHLDRRWVQYQRMEQVSLHRYGPDKPDKDHGAVAATATAVLVAGRSESGWRAATTRRSPSGAGGPNCAGGRIGSTPRSSRVMNWSACTAIIRQRCNAAIG